MSKQHSHQGELVAGALIGGALVGLATLALTSKKGKEATQDVSDKIEEYRDRVENYLDELNENIEQGKEEWCGKAENTIEYIKGEANRFAEGDHRELVVGLIIGGLLGLGSARLFTASSSAEADKEFLDKIGSNASSIKRVIHELAEVADQGAEKKNYSGKAESVDDVIDFALSGLQLWRSINKKK